MGINRSEVIDVPARTSNLTLNFNDSDSYGSYQSQNGTPSTQGSSGEEVANTKTTSARKNRKKRASFILKAQKFSGN